MDLLQEYVYIPLDVFQKIVQNKGVRNKLEAWLMFFSTDEPEKMAELMEKYPEFQKMYREIYELCLNVEKVMEKAPDRATGEDGLPVPPYALYNIGNNNPENLLDFVQILSEELVRAGVLPEDYDFEAHKELVPM